MIKKVSQTPIIYQTKSGALELRGDFRDETLWATQAQIADLFEIDRTVVTKHINNIIKSGEVAKSNVQKMHIANSDKPVAFYSLDIILSVGYRSNSDRAITFRKWATKVLREHMIDGYTVNKTRIAQNYTAFLQAVDDIKKFLPEGGQVDAGSVLELVTAFADTWFSLDAYDREALVMTGATHQEVTLTVRELAEALKVFRQALIEKGEATEFFGREKDTSGIASIVANVMQSFGEDDVYPTLEEKAAHLLYFTVKNHPFIDGNKRSGAYAFVWFLQATGILDVTKITPPALTALTILIAESDPKHKDRMIGLVLQILKK
jgi:prophage maintenance system killer protein/prophage antirepressor-like protein